MFAKEVAKHRQLVVQPVVYGHLSSVYSPPRMPVTTRIVIFLVGNSNLNLHLLLFLGAGVDLMYIASPNFWTIKRCKKLESMVSNWVPSHLCMTMGYTEFTWVSYQIPGTSLVMQKTTSPSTNLLVLPPKKHRHDTLLKWHAFHRIPTITFFTHTKITLLLSEVKAASSWWKFHGERGYFTQVVLVKGRFWKRNFSVNFFGDLIKHPRKLDVDHDSLEIFVWTRWALDPVMNGAKEPLWMALSMGFTGRACTQQHLSEVPLRHILLEWKSPTIFSETRAIIFQTWFLKGELPTRRKTQVNNFMSGTSCQRSRTTTTVLRKWSHFISTCLFAITSATWLKMLRYFQLLCKKCRPDSPTTCHTLKVSAKASEQKSELKYDLLFAMDFVSCSSHVNHKIKRSNKKFYRTHSLKSTCCNHFKRMPHRLSPNVQTPLNFKAF